MPKSNLIPSSSPTGQNEKRYTRQYVKQANRFVRAGEEGFEFTWTYIYIQTREYQKDCNQHENTEAMFYIRHYIPSDIVPLYIGSHPPGVIRDMSEVSSWVMIIVTIGEYVVLDLGS